MSEVHDTARYFFEAVCSKCGKDRDSRSEPPLCYQCATKGQDETTTTMAIGTGPMTRLGEIPDSHPKAKRKRRRRKDEASRGPELATLKKNRKPLTPEERAEVMKRKAVWHHGPKGEESPGVWKAVVDGKTWYASNTHRAYSVRPTLRGAISRFAFIKSTA
jgi:hypothetical protein